MPPNPTPQPADAGPIKTPVRLSTDRMYVVDADSVAIARAGVVGRAAQIVAALNATASHDKLVEALEAAEEYFDQRADAEYLPGKAAPVGNEEMALLVTIRAALPKPAPTAKGETG